MSLRATVMFLVVIDAYGQAPRSPPRPKSAAAQLQKARTGDSVC